METIARMKTRTILASAALILLDIGLCGAQTELWGDYYATFRGGEGLTFEVNPGFSKGMKGATWLDTYLSGSATYQPLDWLSTDGNFEIHYTFDKSTENVLELRPWVGINAIWPTFGDYLNLFYPSLSVRLEERFFWYEESGTQDRTTRLRLRLFTRFPLNYTTLARGTYYLLFLAEIYASLDGEAREVSSDKRRFQGGLGYVVDTHLRLELQYILMRQRNSYTNSYETTSNIIWLAVRNYF
jgi:hypothetical protein